MSEGLVVQTWDDGLGAGRWYVEVEEWMKKAKGKKRKSKAMYAVASALLFKTKEEAQAYLRSAGMGNGEDGDIGDDGDDCNNGDEGGDGDWDKGGDGGDLPAPSLPAPDMESDMAHQGQGRGRVQGKGIVKGKGQGRDRGRGRGKGVGVTSGRPLGPRVRKIFREQLAAHVTLFQ